MTPEQRAKINEILKHQDGLDGEYLDLVMTDLNSLTAEIATLRTRLTALVEAGERVLLRHDGTFYAESINSKSDVDRFRAAVQQARELGKKEQE